MILVIAALILDEQKDGHATGKAKAQSHKRNKSIAFVPDKVSAGDFQVVGQHEDGIMMEHSTPVE
jgi:hypothetical protein